MVLTTYLKRAKITLANGVTKTSAKEIFTHDTRKISSRNPCIPYVRLALGGGKKKRHKKKDIQAVIIIPAFFLYHIKV